MANFKVGKPTKNDFEACYSFMRTLESLTDNRMYSCALESDWTDWDEDDEEYKILSELRSDYCRYADKDVEDLDIDDYKIIMWNYVKWFFNAHPSSLARVIMCADIAMDNAFDNSEEVKTIEWNKRCSEALDMWDKKHKEENNEEG